MQDQPTEEQLGVVVGWRDISHYLGISVSTARRWHEDLGLPVASRGSSAQYRVFTSKSLIDKWIYARAKVRRDALLAARVERDRCRNETRGENDPLQPA